MPPQIVLDAPTVTSTEEEATTAVVFPEVQKQLYPNRRSWTGPWPILLRTVLFASPVWYALNKASCFEAESNAFWLSVLLVAVVVDASSLTLNTTLQYIFPLTMTAYYIGAAEVYPTYIQASLVLVIAVFLIGICMSVCLHRYFAHNAFETSRAMQFVFGVMGCFAYQGGPLWWAAKHVRHHHFCDQPNDPHSVVQQGFWYAWFGWTLDPHNSSQRDTNYNSPHHVVPEIQFLDKYYLVPIAVAFTILEVSGTCSRSTLAFNALLPMLICRLITLLFNVEYHPILDPARCKSIDNDRLLAIIVGEARHDTHHRKPSQSKRDDLDLPYWLTICWMEKVGLIWNCR